MRARHRDVIITRDVDIRSIFFASGWGIYIEVYGNNACFLTPRSELCYSVIYLNGTSMNIEQKTFVQQVEPPLCTYQCGSTAAQRDPVQTVF